MARLHEGRKLKRKSECPVSLPFARYRMPPARSCANVKLMAGFGVHCDWIWKIWSNVRPFAGFNIWLRIASSTACVWLTAESGKRLLLYDKHRDVDISADCGMH